MDKFYVQLVRDTFFSSDRTYLCVQSDHERTHYIVQFVSDTGHAKVRQQDSENNVTSIYILKRYTIASNESSICNTSEPSSAGLATEMLYKVASSTPM